MRRVFPTGRAVIIVFSLEMSEFRMEEYSFILKTSFNQRKSTLVPR